jgi:glyoxylase-like metal-dependent hydrolase (beta-lactamase superfamily II)
VGEQPSFPGVTRDALRDLVLGGRFEAMDGEKAVTPAITAIPAPGHTPGHTVFAISNGGQRAMVLGDSMYCPAQLTELDVGAMHDVDPELARRTREMIARDVEAHATLTIGCHFAGGRAARMVDGRAAFD